MHYVMHYAMQVAAALSIKKLFTGDLGAPVACYPPFPGEERHYLRTQIARIAQATVLVPAACATRVPQEAALGSGPRKRPVGCSQ